MGRFSPTVLPERDRIRLEEAIAQGAEGYARQQERDRQRERQEEQDERARAAAELQRAIDRARAREAGIVPRGEAGPGPGAGGAGRPSPRPGRAPTEDDTGIPGTEVQGAGEGRLPAFERGGIAEREGGTAEGRAGALPATGPGGQFERGEGEAAGVASALRRMRDADPRVLDEPVVIPGQYSPEAGGFADQTVRGRDLVPLTDEYALDPSRTPGARQAQELEARKDELRAAGVPDRFLDAAARDDVLARQLLQGEADEQDDEAAYSDEELLAMGVPERFIPAAKRDPAFLRSLLQEDTGGGEGRAGITELRFQDERKRRRAELRARSLARGGQMTQKALQRQLDADPETAGALTTEEVHRIWEQERRGMGEEEEDRFTDEQQEIRQGLRQDLGRPTSRAEQLALDAATLGASASEILTRMQQKGWPAEAIRDAERYLRPLMSEERMNQPRGRERP